jgi:hypothetical protein
MTDEAEGQTAAGPEPATAPSQPGRPAVDASVCLCAGLGPLLTQALRTLTVPDELKRTVHETEREALRLLRTLIEMRLSTLGDDGQAKEGAGTKIPVV